jgi:hypothetical protein
LTPSTDPFFQAHYLATFGDLGTSLKDYVQSYQSRYAAQAPSSINSISDMKRFVEEYPEFRKLGGNVSKHVALVGELSRLVGRDKLLEVGEVEQGLATSSGADIKVRQAIESRSAKLTLGRPYKRSSLIQPSLLGLSFASSFFMPSVTKRLRLEILRLLSNSSLRMAF